MVTYVDINLNRPTVKPGFGSHGNLRVVITGAAEGVGRECAFAFASAGAQLILCDHDGWRLNDLGRTLGAFTRFCDVASEASVAIFAAEILSDFAEFNIVINAAGSGYVRSLGMMQTSRALLPGLRRASGRKLIANVAPTDGQQADMALFPYGGSDIAFSRLSDAVARITR